MLTYTNVLPITRTVTLDTQKVGDNLNAYRLTTRHVLGKATGTLKNAKDIYGDQPPVEGLIDDKNLKAMVAGRDYSTKGNLYWMSSEALEAFRTSAPGSDIWNERYSVGRRDLFAVLVEEGQPLENVVRSDELSSGHVLVNIHGDALPVALYYDYIRGRFNSTQYDLEALAAHLLARDDVDVYIDTRRWTHRGDERKIAETVEECMFRIPHYNGGGTAIQFLWKPSTEVWERGKKAKYRSNVVHGNAVEMDVLDIEQFRLPKKIRDQIEKARSRDDY
jgi:hypothetical protein